MKKILSIVVLSIAIMLGSCNKAIDEQPISEGLLGTFLRNKIEADAALAGMYGEFQQTMIGDGQYQNRINWWGESRADNWERRATYTVNASTEIHFNALTEINQFADWSFLYSTINRANFILKKVPEIKNYAPSGTIGSLTSDQENSYMSQAYAMRALCYFWIARVWGDAPIRTEPYLSLDQQSEQAQDPQEKVLDHCISDLDKAYTLVAKNQTPVVWYLGEGAICSIMADIYMWRKDYNNAIIWFKRLFAAKAPTGKVYNSAGVTATGAGGALTDLVPATGWNAQFITPATSVESIFSIHWDFAANGCACMAGTSRTDNEPWIRMADPLWTNWPRTNQATYPLANGSTVTSTTDIRVKQTYNITSATNQPIRDRSFWKFYPGTFVPANPGSPAIPAVPATPTTPAIPAQLAVLPAQYTFTPTVYNNNLPATRETNVYIPLYRLSGMYLLYAEALNKVGDKGNAVKYLNLIKARAAVPTVTALQFATEAALEAEILQERQYELIGEGVRWFDLVRTDRVKEIMDPILNARQTEAGLEVTGWGTDKRKYYWPLATRVLYSNGLLVQNQPY